jgi:hypothetical protein
MRTPTEMGALSSYKNDLLRLAFLIIMFRKLQRISL